MFKCRGHRLCHSSQLAEAEQNLERLKEEVAVPVERSYVATQVAQLCQESERLARRNRL